MEGKKDNEKPTQRQNGAPSIKEVELSGKDAKEKLAELLAQAKLGMSATPPEEKEYKFWSTQPVPQMKGEDERLGLGEHGHPIEQKTIDDVPKRPYALIDAFEWSQVDVTDDTQLEEAYRLLNENYVEDSDSSFRFDYSRDFLRWALLPPGWQPSWHVGVRVKSSKKLVAFITAIPAKLQVHGDTMPIVEINFLCVHKKLRSKRLAPVLIREITRLVNLTGIWQAAYTAGAVLPRPLTTSRYYHRSLNPKKLIEVGFSRMQPRMTMNRTIKLYAVKTETSTPGIRVMREDDIPAVQVLLEEYLKQFDMYAVMNQEELKHWILPREGVIYSYVVEDPETKDITDFFSFYSLPSSIIKHPTYKTLNAAYSYCTVATKVPIVDLLRDALVLARHNDFDVFNALDLGRNSEFFKELKFHSGDGRLNYYLYNWKCRPIDKKKNALVLL